MRRFFLISSFLTLFAIGSSAQWKPAGDKIKTDWASQINPANVLPEYPRPIMERSDWKNLNGLWNYAVINKGEHLPAEFEGQILVPFAIESSLSGVGKRINENQELVYQRSFEIPSAWKGKQVLLHFGAVDWKTDVWVNDVKVGSHTGGFTPFSFDITAALSGKGNNQLVVKVWDPTDKGPQPRGKQVSNPEGIWYTPVSGIWQTVWLEWVPESYIEKVQYYPNLAEATLGIKAVVKGQGTLEAKAFYGGEPCGSVSAKSEDGTVTMTLPLSRLEKWEPGHGRLYDLTLTYGEDKVESYFGMREVRLDGEKFLINDKSVFHRLVLDQGFYPDGIYTAPTEEALVKDVELSMAAGFNGARLHQKVFEPLFLYHCDKAGYLVWGEQGCWGLDYSNPAALKYFLPEWMEALERDFNHPAIIGWCPFNETWDYEGRRQDDSLLANVYKMTKLYDTTRPCIDTSGNYHVVTDIYDLHNYEQDPAKFAATYESFKQGGDLEDTHGYRQTPVKGIPTFISEYGGIKWDEEGVEKDGWGYGAGPATKEEFLNRYKGLTDALLDNPHMFAFCYTQLYDVEQELNGLYTYERKPKFDMDVIKAINARKAAIED